jgi:hypothetical protein
MLTVGNLLRVIFMHCVTRFARYEIAFLPYLILFNFRRADREFFANIKTIREYTK